MSVFFVVMVIVLFTLPSLLHVTYGEPNGDGIEVITSSVIFDSRAQAHVLGEVMNKGERSVDDVFIVAVFYEDDRSVASNHASIQMNTLRPGERSAFDIVVEEIQDTEEGPEFDSYDLSVHSRTAGPKTACLSLNVTENFLDETGNYHVAGMVMNNGSQLTDSIRVSATFYNTTGHVTAINAMTVVNEDDGETLHPDENAAFDLTGMPYNANSTISSYSINVESAQYSMINDAITKDNIECLVELSTSLTLHINSTMSNSPLTQDLLVSGKVAALIEDERYVTFEIYNQNEQLYHRETCELDEDNSYLCTVTFYHLNEHDFVLRAGYAGALAELTFTNPNSHNETNGSDIDDGSSSIGSVRVNSTVALSDGNILGNSSSQFSPKIMLTTNLTNNNLHLQAVTMIIQIKDSNDAVVFLDFYNTVLAPAENSSLISEWIPDIDGTVTIEVFVWDSIGDNSYPLSEVSRKQVLLTSPTV